MWYCLHLDQCHLLVEAHPPVDVHTAQGGETACDATPIFAGVGVFFQKVFLVFLQAQIFCVEIHLLEGVAE